MAGASSTSSRIATTSTRWRAGPTRRDGPDQPATGPPLGLCLYTPRRRHHDGAADGATTTLTRTAPSLALRGYVDVFDAARPMWHGQAVLAQTFQVESDGFPH